MPSYRNRIIGIQMFKYNITMLLHFGFNYYFKRAALGGTAEVINPFFATDADGMQSLAITDLNTMKTKSLGKYVSMFKTQCDIRCDLHARYVFDGKYVSFDTTHRGRREIAVFPIEEINI